MTAYKGTCQCDWMFFHSNEQVARARMRTHIQKSHNGNAKFEIHRIPDAEYQLYLRLKNDPRFWVAQRNRKKLRMRLEKKTIGRGRYRRNIPNLLIEVI